MPRSTQLTNVRHRNAAPTGYTHGDTYFDEVTQRLYVAWAGAWVPIGGGSSTWKQPVRMAAASNVTRSGTGTTIDGITPVVGDRVLLMGQTAATENGIYVVASGAWARAADAATGTDLIGAAVVVGSGTVYKDTTWLCTNDVLTLGSTAVVWAPLGVPEVNVSTAGPSPRVGQLLWVDTDDTPAATTTPWTTLPLLNGWGNFDVNGGPGQSGFQWAEYRRVGDQVWTRGLITNGVATIGTAIANLPAGFRPAHRQMQMTATATTQLAARLDVLTSGDIVCDAGVSAGWLNLVTSFSTL